MPASFFRGFLQRYVRRLPSSFSMEIRGNLRCSFFKPARSCVSVGANAASEGKIRNDCSACRQVRQAFFFGIRPRRRKGVIAPGGGAFPAGCRFRRGAPQNHLGGKSVCFLRKIPTERKISAVHSRQQRVRGAKTGREKSCRGLLHAFDFHQFHPGHCGKHMVNFRYFQFAADADF